MKMTSSLPLVWRARSDCPEHLRDTLEKAVNAYPPEWLQEPTTGEIYSNMNEAHSRLIAFSLSQGFDVVIAHSTQKPQPVTTFSCIHHGTETKNWRKLPDRVEKDKEGKVIGERKLELSVVRQTGCPWACRVSYKNIGKRGSGQRGYVLTVKDLSHGDTHRLTSNSFIYQRHRERLVEYQVLRAQARAHRVSVLPYSLSRRVLDAVDSTGLSLTRKEYYRIQKISSFDAKNDSTIEGLLYALDDAGFVHRCRIDDTYDEAGQVISRKLVQIWFTHLSLIEASAQFVAGSVCIIDATFNTNEKRLPFIVAVGILSNGKTFSIAFSYCRAEDHESYAFFWESLKAHWPVGTVPPAVVVSDQAGAILSSLQEQYPDIIHQICEWHAVEAMCAKFRQFHTNFEIAGGKDDNGDMVVGLKDLAYAYVKSETKEDLETNRKDLVDALKSLGKDYIEGIWRHKEDRVVRYYTLLNFNLGCHSSQRVESYHVVLKQMTNGQLSLEESARTLIRTVIKGINDMKTERDNELRTYSRLAQSPVFRELRMNIPNYALTKVALAYDNLCKTAPQNPPEMGDCECVLLLQWGLPCIHYLYPYYLSGRAIPRSLCHPRWWIEGGPIQINDWSPLVEYLPNPHFERQPLFTAVEREVLELREGLNIENRHQFDRQRARRQEMVDEQMLEIGAAHLRRQAIPIEPPDAVSKRSWIKANTHGRADARGLTGNELGQRRQRREAREEAHKTRIAEQDFRQQLIEASGQDSQMSTITIAARPPIERPSTPTPSSQSSLISSLPIRTPATPERPRPRRTPTPEDSPLQASAFEAPAFTAPPKLGREKRKRPHTRKYQESRAQGDILESQEAHKAERRG
jgi:hypothetical protein